MPLFKCTKCGVIENTALSACSWGNWMGNKNVLCSECCPEQEKWHSKFPKKYEFDEGEEDHFNR